MDQNLSTITDVVADVPQAGPFDQAVAAALADAPKPTGKKLQELSAIILG